MARPGAGDRLARILAMVPWVVAADGPRVADVCERFGITKDELTADLELLYVCGLHPYTPDTLIDTVIERGRVWIRYADYFARPLRLTPEEALALVAAGEGLLSGPGVDRDGPLARGLAKLAGVLGVEPGTMDIRLGDAAEPVLEVLRRGVEEHRRVLIDYYAYGRDRRTERTVDPWAVFSGEGQWYLAGWCHQVDDERLFRVDRISSSTLLDATFEPPERAPDMTVFDPRPDDPRVTLEMDRQARWVAEQYPHEGIEELGDGRFRITLVAAEPAWLERLLLRLGPLAKVVEGDPGVAAAAAARVLARYRG